MLWTAALHFRGDPCLHSDSFNAEKRDSNALGQTNWNDVFTDIWKYHKLWEQLLLRLPKNPGKFKKLGDNVTAETFSLN